MARIAKRFYAGDFVGGGAFNNVATVPAGKKWEIVSVFIANDDPSAHTPRIQLAGTTVVCNILAASTSTLFSTFAVLNAGEQIAVKGAPSVLTTYISGVEVDV